MQDGAVFRSLFDNFIEALFKVKTGLLDSRSPVLTLKTRILTMGRSQEMIIFFKVSALPGT